MTAPAATQIGAVECSARPALTGARRRLAIASILAAMAAAVLDSSSVNIALPAIARSLHLAPQQAIWLVTAYQAALVAGLLPLATIGERYGHRRTFILGLILFVGCATVCTFAPNFACLVGARILQGLGAAAIMALGVALLRQTVTPAELGPAIGWNAMTVAFFTAAGPTVGAGLLSLGDWRLVFAGGLPIGLVAICSGFALPRAGGISSALERVSVMLYAAIVTSFVTAAALASSRPAASFGLAALGAAGAMWLVQRDRRRASPFLPLDLLRNTSFSASVAASIWCFIGQGLGLLALPFALHLRLGATALEIGALMTPWPLAVLLTTPFATRLLRRVNSASLCAAGGICLSAGLGGLALIPAEAGILPHLLSIIACGVGFGLFQTPNNRNMFMSAPVERSASAGGLQGTARLAGQTIGGLVITSLLSLFSIPTATQAGFAIAALATFVAGTISLYRHGEERLPGGNISGAPRPGM